MNKVLGQNEIDALFAQAGLAAEGDLGSTAATAEAYNFMRAGRISSEQMKAISTVNDLFARNLMHTVGAWLRTEFQVNLVAGEQITYAEMLGRIDEPTYVSSIRLEPLGAVGLLELDLALAAPVVDLLLGGTGQAAAEVRQLTDIEELIMASVAGMIVKELNVSWQALGLHFSFEKRETGAQISRMMASGERMLCVSFEVKMPEASGELTLCLPAVVLNTTLRQLINDEGRQRRRTDDVVLRVRELLGEARVGTSLQFPPVRLRAWEIANLAPGSVLRLPLPTHSAAELRVGGLSFAPARPVRMGEHRGARLERSAAGSEMTQPIQ